MPEFADPFSVLKNGRLLTPDSPQGEDLKYNKVPYYFH